MDRESVKMSSASAYRPAVGLRWDRVGRLAMIAVIVALLVLYVRSGLSLWGAWQTSRVDAAKVRVLQVQHSRLQQQRDLAGEPWVVEEQARRLGLAHRGEKPYVVRGLPHD